jgi:hypothetical protein
MNNALVPVSRVTMSSLDTFEDCVRAAQALKGKDPVEHAAAILTILTRAAEIGINDTQAETLLNELRRATGHGKISLKKLWQTLKEKAAKEREAKASADAAQRAADYQARQKQAKDEYREQLWASCSVIAEYPDLLAGMTATVQSFGVVREGAAIRGAYLTFTSRLLKRGAICLLRRGAPAGGKNYLLETTFPLIPEDAVIRVSSSSPLALIYYGDEDEDALKHKIIYISEAAILVEKNGVESPLAIMLRNLISEGRIDRIVTVTRPGAKPVSEHIRRNGPVAVVLTSARSNVEEELLTRLMTSDADESDKQTFRVVRSSFLREEADIGPAETGRWLDFQRWLEIDAPYDAVIPYRRELWLAIVRHWRAMRVRGEKFKVRIRRDSHGLQSAIKTSAIIHKAQRQTDEKGRIMATLDDYAHAHEAFDAGLHQVNVPETLVAVIRAIEDRAAAARKADISDIPALGVQVTVRALMDSLGIASFKTAFERLRDAEALGLIAVVGGPYGPTSARSYVVNKSSKEIEAESRQNLSGNVFPTPEKVRTIFSEINDKKAKPDERHSFTSKTRI